MAKNLDYNIGERLKSIIPRGESQNDFARKIGVPVSTFKAWLGDVSPPKADALFQIAEVTGCDLNWLVTGKHGAGAVIDADEFTYIRKFDVALSAGDGAMDFGANQQPETIGFRTVWLKALTSTPAIGLSVATAKGDSMEPTINDGAQLLVDHTVSTIESDGIFAFLMDDNLFVKRVQQLMTGGLLLKSDNPAYDDQEVADPEVARFVLCGKIRWVGNGL